MDFTAISILRLVDAVAAEPSTKKKQELLKGATLSEREREVFSRILYATYSPRKTYGVTYIEPKENFAPNDNLTVDSNEFWDLIEGLQTRRFSGNAAKEAIFQFMSFAAPATAELFRRVVHQDMRAGFNASTVNKVFPKLIEETPYMRCSLPKDVKFETWPWDRGVYAQLKSDGTFQTITRIDDRLIISSRSGEIMPNEAVPGIVRVMLMCQPRDTRFEGEMIVIDPNGEILPRGEGNGLINSLRQGGELPAGHYVRYVVWDCVNARDGGFLDEREYEDRFLQAATYIETCAGENDFVKLTPFDIVRSLDEAVVVYKRYLAAGLEGAIIKRPDAIYKDGTSKEQVKLKLEKTIEVKITGFVEGAKGKKTEKTFGALKYESECGFVRGSVSGIKDDLRDEINANREEWVGAIIAIKGNALTQNRNEPEYWAVSHPRFDERRTDKVKADDLTRIKAIFDDVSF